MAKHKITPFLWFDGNAEAAVAHYLSIFPDSRILGTMGGPNGSVMGLTFELAGQTFMALNGGPQYRFSPATSFYVSCETQAELDGYWDKLLVGGKATGPGWLDDRFGVTWQIIPSIFGDLLGDPDRAAAGRTMQAMMKMKKLDIAALKKAHAG
jgi:predicted 3-demethylubiquinone-9 3-methyltransferase (glyoxalase superfamily)